MTNTICASKSRWVDMTDMDALRQINTEGMTPTHKPVQHWEILGEFRRQAENRGLHFTEEIGKLSHDHLRYMYTGVVQSNHSDFGFSVGFVNHNDRTKSFVGAVGSRIFICENGLIQGIVVPSRQRHTTGNYNLIGDKVGIILDRFFESRGRMEDENSLLKNTPVTKQFLGEFLLRAHCQSSIGNTNLFRMVDNFLNPDNEIKGEDGKPKALDLILREFENPSLNTDNRIHNAWALSNACTTISTHHIKNPGQQAETSRLCHNILMGMVNPDYQPIGDNVEIDIETDGDGE